jgi:hypothetical protein
VLHNSNSVGGATLPAMCYCSQSQKVEILQMEVHKLWDFTVFVCAQAH